MSFLPVFLWTDILIFLLVAVIAVAAFYIRTQPHLSTPWKSVIKRKRGMISVMILGVYIIVGLLDSLHYRPALDATKNAKEVYYSSDRSDGLELIQKTIVFLFDFKFWSPKCYITVGWSENTCSEKEHVHHGHFLEQQTWPYSPS